MVHALVYLAAAMVPAQWVPGTAPADYPVILEDDFHVGHIHETKSNLAHVSLRYTFFE